MEQIIGFEPTRQLWKSCMLPLHHICIIKASYLAFFGSCAITPKCPQSGNLGKNKSITPDYSLLFILDSIYQSCRE